MILAIDQQLTIDSFPFQKGQTVELAPTTYFPSVALVAYQQMAGKTTFHHLQSGQTQNISFSEAGGHLGIFGILKPVITNGPTDGNNTVFITFGTGAGKDFVEKEAAFLSMIGEPISVGNSFNGKSTDGMDLFDSSVLPDGFLLDVKATLAKYNLPTKSVILKTFMDGRLWIESGVMIQVNTLGLGENKTYLADILDANHTDTERYVNLYFTDCYLSAFIKPKWTNNSDGSVDLIFEIGDPEKDGTIKMRTV